jgi:hypothetical protein
MTEVFAARPNVRIHVALALRAFFKAVGTLFKDFGLFFGLSRFARRIQRV